MDKYTWMQWWEDVTKVVPPLGMFERFNSSVREELESDSDTVLDEWKERNAFGA